MSEIFGKRLRQARENKKKTQVQLGSVFGLTSVAYGAWERNETEPSIKNIVKLCELLDVSADWLLGVDQSNIIEQRQMLDKLAAFRTEAEQTAATLARLTSQIRAMENPAK